MPAVSVIIACYNQEKYITETLDSLLAQSMSDFEVIVVNDGSTDGSLKIIEQYAPKFGNRLCIINQQNQGVVSARNNGVKKALGEWIFALDSDDKIAPTCLEKLYNAALAGKGDVICPQIQTFGERNEILYFEKPAPLNMCLSNQVCASALYRKADFVKYGGYDTAFDDGLEDWDLWLNFVADNKTFYRLDEVLLFYRILPQSRTTGIDKQKKKQIRERLKKKYCQLYKKMALKIFAYKLSRLIWQKKVRNGKLQIKFMKMPLLEIENTSNKTKFYLFNILILTLKKGIVSWPEK